MKILALESSAVACSVCLWEDGRLLAQSFQNSGLTHSRTLMSLCGDLLKNGGYTLDEVDVVAVAAGPGSFTGVRIGVAAVKGLAFARGIPCAAVSTLAAMAENLRGVPVDGVICSVMDARCRQVYTACFDGASLDRLTPDEAISLEDLKIRLLSYKKPIFLVGDGAAMCYTNLEGQVPELLLAPVPLRFQRAAGVAACAAGQALRGELCAAEALQPAYLRLPQAQRELRQRQAAESQPT